MSAQLRPSSQPSANSRHRIRHRSKPVGKSISEVKEVKIKPSAGVGTTMVLLTDHLSFVPWKDFSEIYHKPKHGELPNMFHTGVNHSIPKPDRPHRYTAEELRAMTAAQREDVQYEKEEYSTLYREWVKETSYIKRQSALFFGDIMLTISKVALDKLKENRKVNFEYDSSSDSDDDNSSTASTVPAGAPAAAAPAAVPIAPLADPNLTEWEQVKLSCDPAILYARIVKYFSKPITNNPQTDQLTILNEFLKFMQTQGMTVDQYYEQFKIKVSALEATGTDISQRMQSNSFLNNAHHRFGQFMLNFETTGRKLPKRVTDAKDLLEMWEQNIRDRSSRAVTSGFGRNPTPAAAFISDTPWEKPTNQQGRGGGRGGGRGNDNGRGNQGGRGGRGGRGNGRQSNNSAHVINSSGATTSDNTVTYEFPIDNSRTDDRATRPCNWCGGPHFGANCPRPIEANRQLRARALITNAAPYTSIMLCTTISMNTNSSRSIPNDIIIWDCATNADLFCNSDFLTNIRDSGSSISFSGVGGTFETTLVGDTQHFGTVHYHPDAPANILSQSRRIPQYDVKFISIHNYYRVTNPSKSIFYFNIDKLGMYSYRPSANHQSLITTVKDNMQHYTKRQLANVEKLRLYERRLGYPSTTALRHAIHNGTFLNFPCTNTDLDNMLAIHGPTVAGLKGRIKFHADRSINIEKSFFAKMVQVLHMDVFFVLGHAFIIAVSRPLNLITAYALTDGRGSPSVMKGIQSIVALYNRNLYSVSDIYIDGEGALSKLTDALSGEGINVNQSSKGMHVALAESTIRPVKEHLRAIIHSLPYRMNSILLAAAVYFVINRINLLPTIGSLSKESARERLTGIKADARIVLTSEFGESIQIYDAPTFSNGMEPRTISAIALNPTNNLQGSIYCYTLATGEIVSRSKWTSLPMTADIITILNQRSSGKFQVHMDPEILVRIDAASFCDPSHIIPYATTNDITTTTVILPHYDNEDQQLEDSSEPDEIHPSNSEAPMYQIDLNESSDVESDDESDDEGDVRTDDTPHPPHTVDPITVAATIDYDSESDEENVEDEVLSPPSQPIKVNPGRNMTTRGMANSEGTLGKAHYTFHMSVKKCIEKHKDAAIIAMNKELYSMITKQVFFPVKLESMTRDQIINRLVRTTMFLREKLTPDGLLDMIKARLVALGNHQDRSLYKESDISSPTASITSLFIILSIAAHMQYHCMSMDIGTAYLNATLPRGQLFLKLDKLVTTMLAALDPSVIPFIDQKGELVVEARKALYGSLEAGKLWFNMISAVFTNELNFTQNAYDKCVFWIDSVEHGRCIVLLFVDDMFVCAASEAYLKIVHQHMINKFGEVKCTTGLVHSFLGLALDFSIKGEVKIRMDGYIRDMIKCYNVTRKAKTPARNDIFAINPESPLLSSSDKALYYSAAYKLLYVGKRTRPEILLAVNFLTTRAHNPTQEDMTKLHRVLEYLNSDPALPMILRIGDEFQLYTFADASHAIHRDMKGHNGVIIQLGDACIYHKSSKQKMNSKSSTEAELINLSDAVPMTIWCNNFLKALDYEMPAAYMLQDNISTITMVNRGTHIGESTRHIDIRFFYIHDYIINGLIITGFCPTDYMMADGHTKPTQGAQFAYCTGKMLGVKHIKN